jgi:hypothetical protein
VSFVDFCKTKWKWFANNFVIVSALVTVSFFLGKIYESSGRKEETQGLKSSVQECKASSAEALLDAKREIAALESKLRETENDVARMGVLLKLDKDQRQSLLADLKEVPNIEVIVEGKPIEEVYMPKIQHPHSNNRSFAADMVLINRGLRTLKITGAELLVFPGYLCGGSELVERGDKTPIYRNRTIFCEDLPSCISRTDTPVDISPGQGKTLRIWFCKGQWRSGEDIRANSNDSIVNNEFILGEEVQVELVVFADGLLPFRKQLRVIPRPSDNTEKAPR